MSIDHRNEDVRVIRGRGPRAVEERLLADLAVLLAELRAEFNGDRGAASGAMRPVLVVVPTGSLRRHLAARIAAVLGPVALGVSVATPGRVARDVLARSGRKVPGGGALFGIVARRAIADEPVLRSALEAFEDGFGAALGSVRDLLSAGLEAEHEAALGTVVERLPAGAISDRAGAVLRAAAATQRAMRDLGAGRESDVYAAATRVVEDDAGVGLPWGPVLFHGFADAPGRTARFLGGLLRACGGTLYLDEPEDPASPGTRERGASFLGAFVARLGPMPDPEEDAAPPLPAVGKPAVFEARGEGAEIREVAVRIRRLLDAEVSAESIAVVCRDIGPYAIAVRRHFDLLGIPFSGLSAPPWLFPARRRLDAVLRILEEGPRTDIDTWLDAREPPRGTRAGPEREVLDTDLRVGLKVVGATSLEQVASLDPDLLLDDARGGLALPARLGLIGDDAGGGRAEGTGGFAGKMSQRRLSGPRLRKAIADAGALIAELASWPAEGSVEELGAVIGQLLREHVLPAGPPDAAGTALNRALSALATLHRPELSLSPAEFLELLRSQLAKVPDEALGGRGAGALVLDLAHARSLCFEHLFLLGLDRGTWPRAASEDSLLPDAVRDPLREVLPDLALRRDRDAEERYLFAQLVAAAPRVTLSRCRTDEEGRERSPSPFLEALSARDRLEEEVAATPRNGIDALSEGAAPLAASEAATLAGLHGDRASVRELLGEALREAGVRFPDLPPLGDADAVAAARIAVLDEQDPDLRDARGRARRRAPGAYQGFVGPARSDADPRHADLFITGLENLARCPWRSFLEKHLRLEALPDPATQLPTLDSALIGNAVHAVLEELVVRAMGVGAPKETADLLRREPVPMARPDDAEVELTIAEVAVRSAREQGIHLAGMHRALALRIAPMVRRALDCDWGEAGTVMVLGAEAWGAAPLGREEAARPVHFRADRVDATASGLLVTDYKTGKPKTPKDLQRGLRDGTMLQGAAYAALATGATGRYLYLEPNAKPERASLLVESEHGRVALDRAGEILLDALHHGALFPRVEDLKEETPQTCGYCEVAAACFRSDSGYRRRLRELAHRARDRIAASGPEGFDPLAADLARAWFIAEAEAETAASEEEAS